MNSHIHDIFPKDLPVSYLMLAKGESLFSQGNSVSKIYFINSGRIKLVRNTIEGSSVVIHIGSSGETIAEASIFSDCYHCTAIADSISEVSFVKKSALLSLLKSKPEETLKLLAIFSGQIRDLRSLSEIKNIRSANKRIMSYLMSNMNENKEVIINTSLKDIAQNIGLAHETFYRELKSLEESEQVKRLTKSIKLL
jgi:CRP-like cAMP-binding protein